MRVVLKQGIICLIVSLLFSYCTPKLFPGTLDTNAETLSVQDSIKQDSARYISSAGDSIRQETAITDSVPHKTIQSDLAPAETRSDGYYRIDTICIIGIRPTNIEICFFDYFLGSTHDNGP